MLLSGENFGDENGHQVGYPAHRHRDHPLPHGFEHETEGTGNY